MKKLTFKKLLFSLILLVFGRTIVLAQTVSTIAGSGSAGFVDATGILASFNSPKYIAVDGLGNIYVTEPTSYKIRKITPTGVVSTFAGSGVSGYADGTGTAASFAGILGIASDNDGNLFVADAGNYRIRKVTSAGVVTTYAGNGTSAIVNGASSIASFGGPNGIAVDRFGNVYVSELGHVIRKITSTGVVSTLAGFNYTDGYADGVGSAVRFNIPVGMATDTAGNLYVADYFNSRIRKITIAGAVSTFAGSGSAGSIDGTGISATFNNPHGLTIDRGGNLYIADPSNHKIRKITPLGEVTTIAGSGVVGSADGVGVLASFNYPIDVAIDNTGNLYVADGVNNKIRKISLSCTVPDAPTASTIVQPTFSVPTGTIQITAPLGSLEYSKDGSSYQLSPIFAQVSPGQTYALTARDYINITCVSPATNVLVDEAPVNSIYGFSMNEKNVELYPNPVKNEVYMSIPIEMQSLGKYEVIISDVNGKSIQNIIINSSLKVMKLNIEGLTKGLYTIYINGENKRAMGKFVVTE